MILDFREYLSYTLEKLNIRIAEVVSELAGLYQEESTLLAHERDARARDWMASEYTSIAARDRAAEYGSRTITNEVFKVRGRIKKLIEEKELLFYLAKVQKDKVEN